MDSLIEQIFNGVSLGSILLIVALGLSFTFGQMGVINMAHGELIMIGAYTPYFLQSESGWFDGGASSTAFVVALPLGFVAAGLVGMAMERTLLRRMVGRPLDTLLVTFGISLILQQAARDTFGAPNVDVVSPTWLTGRLELLGVVMPHRRLFIIALVILAVAALSAFLATRPEGRRMRAVMQNRDLAEVSGLSTRRVDRTTFFLGSALAGLAGVAVSLVGSVGSQVGTGYIVDAFLVVIVGGLGKLRGAIVAALALGLLNAFSEFWTSASIGKAVVFVAVIAFLQFRPNGLVSFRTRGLVA